MYGRVRVSSPPLYSFCGAQVWLDKTSDAALTHFARSGLGAHRVELAPDTNPFGAKYMVRTNALAALEV